MKHNNENIVRFIYSNISNNETIVSGNLIGVKNEPSNSNVLFCSGISMEYKYVALPTNDYKCKFSKKADKILKTNRKL